MLKRLHLSHIDLITQSYHWSVLIVVKSIATINCFLYKRLITCSWLALRRYYSSFIYFCWILFILCSSACFSKYKEYSCLSKAGFFYLKILLMKLYVTCYGFSLSSCFLWLMSWTCLDRVSFISRLLLSFSLASCYFFFRSSSSLRCCT